MKKFKKIIAWAILSLILQIGGLFVLDQFVFKLSSEFKSKKIEVETDKTKNINGTVPSGAENISISFNGKYMAYYLDNVLYMEDTKTGTKSQVKTEGNGTILYCKWLSDRDRLIIAEKVNKDGTDKIHLITYNPKNSTETKVSDITTYKKNMEVSKITESPLTGVYYVKISTGGLKSQVYRIDINDALSKVTLNANVLGNIEVIPHQDRLIYEDESDNTFFATSPSEKLAFHSNKKLTLLGIDRNDVIYMGELNGEKISSITYGKLEEKTSNWKSMNLESVVGRHDLYFSNNSEILINDNLKGSVKNLTTGVETEYEGKLIEIKEGFIATVSNDGKLVYKNLEKNTNEK